MHWWRIIYAEILNNSSALIMRQLKIPADKLLIFSTFKDPAMCGRYSENCFWPQTALEENCRVWWHCFDSRCALALSLFKARSQLWTAKHGDVLIINPNITCFSGWVSYAQPLISSFSFWAESWLQSMAACLHWKAI